MSLYLPQRGPVRCHPPGEAAGVPVDGPDNWRVPVEAGHFDALGLARPDYSYGLQEASGSLGNSIGAALPLAVNATGHLYRQTVAGWTRKFIGTDDTTAGQSWRTSSALLDLAAGESMAMVLYASFTTPAASRLLMTWNAATDGLYVTNTGLPRPLFNAVGTNSATDHGGIGTVHQLCIYRNATSNTSGFVSELSAHTGTHYEGAFTGQVKGLFGGSTGTVARYGVYWIWKGANAERDWAAYLATLRGA